MVPWSCQQFDFSHPWQGRTHSRHTHFPQEWQATRNLTCLVPMLLIEPSRFKDQLEGSSSPPGKPAISGKSIAVVSAFLYHLLHGNGSSRASTPACVRTNSSHHHPYASSDRKVMDQSRRRIQLPAIFFITFCQVGENLLHECDFEIAAAV